MVNNITSVTENILPGEKVDCVVYGCTSGTIISGYDNIKKKINIAKPDALVTAPSTAALNAPRGGVIRTYPSQQQTRKN